MQLCSSFVNGALTQILFANDHSFKHQFFQQYFHDYEILHVLQNLNCTLAPILFFQCQKFTVYHSKQRGGRQWMEVVTLGECLKWKVIL